MPQVYYGRNTARSPVDTLRTCPARAKIYAVHRRGIAPIALILLGAVACTSSGSGGTTPRPTSTLPGSSTAPTSTTPTAPSTSASPSVATTGPNVRPGEKPPMLSKYGAMNTRLGSLEFGNYWMRAVDWAYATMDTALARSIMSSKCTGCNKLLSLDIDKLAASGSYYRGGRIAILESTIQPNIPHNGSTAIIDVTVDQAALTSYTRAGEVVDRSPDSGRVTFRTWIAYAGDHWLVVDWRQAVATK